MGLETLQAASVTMTMQLVQLVQLVQQEAARALRATMTIQMAQQQSHHSSNGRGRVSVARESYDAEDVLQMAGSLAPAIWVLEVTPGADLETAQLGVLKAAWETPAAQLALAWVEQTWTTQEAAAAHRDVPKPQKHWEQCGMAQE